MSTTRTSSSSPASASLKAVDEFDLDCPHSLLTFVVYKCWGAIGNYVRDQRGTVRAPKNVSVKESTHQAARAARCVVSLDTPLDSHRGVEGNQTFIDLLVSPDGDPEGLCERAELFDVVSALMESKLSDRERDVLRRRAGLGDVDGGETLAEIGVHYGLVGERIRQIEARALEKLRGLLRTSR